MTDLSARPDLGAYLQTQYQPAEVVVKEIADVLGLSLLAYIGGFASPDEVNAYYQGRSYRQTEVDARLRLALRVAKVVGEADAGNVAAWFQGQNPQLSDASPAWMLKEGDLKDVEPVLLAAARAYAIGG
jgi:hypothetical protein